MTAKSTPVLRSTSLVFSLLTVFSLIGCQKDPALKPKNDGLRLVRLKTLSTGGWVGNSEKVINFEYDKDGRLVKSSDGYETIKYEYANDRISTVSKFHNSPNGQLSVGSYKNRYDSNGRLTGYESFDSAGRLTCQCQLVYDSEGYVIEFIETFTPAFVRRHTYSWRQGNVTLETVTDNGVVNSTTNWIALDAYNPYRLFPPGAQPWWPGLVSVKSLTNGPQEGKLTISKHSSGYPSSVKRSKTLSSFTTWYDYVRF